MRGINIVDPGAVPGASTIIPAGLIQTARLSRYVIRAARSYGGEIDSTRVVKTHLLPGIVPPSSGYILNANDNNVAFAVAA